MVAVQFMQHGIKFTKCFTQMAWALIVLWFDITHGAPKETEVYNDRTNYVVSREFPNYIIEGVNH